MDFWDLFLLLIIWIPLILMLVFSLVDLFHRPLPGWAKALWALFIVFIPVIGVIVYFIARPSVSTQYAVSSPGQTGAGEETSAGSARLTDLHDRGMLDASELAKARTYLVR